MVRHIVRAYRWLGVLWFHLAIAAVAGLIYVAFSKGTHVATELFINRNGEGIFVFIAGGFAANVLSGLPLLRRGRTKARWGICRQFAILYLACLPFYGPIYYARKLSALESQDDIT